VALQGVASVAASKGGNTECRTATNGLVLEIVCAAIPILALLAFLAWVSCCIDPLQTSPGVHHGGGGPEVSLPRLRLHTEHGATFSPALIHSLGGRLALSGLDSGG
jgi:hypothetical protein